MEAKGQHTFAHLPKLDNVGPKDIFARGINGQVYQRKVIFGKHDLPPVVSWVPFRGGGTCNAPTDRYMRDIDDYDGDPRVAVSKPSVRRKYRGNPEER